MKPIDRADQVLRLMCMIIVLLTASTIGATYFTLRELWSKFKLWRM